MQESIKRVELGGEKLDTVVGVSFFRTNEKGKKEVLLVKGKSGQWYFPGGKIRDGESYDVGLRRELKEELGLEDVGEFGGFFIDSYEINGERFAIANTTAKDELKQEPEIGLKDSVRDFVWTEDPLSLDLTIQTRQILLKEKMGWNNTTSNYDESKISKHV